MQCWLKSDQHLGYCWSKIGATRFSCLKERHSLKINLKTDHQTHRSVFTWLQLITIRNYRSNKWHLHACTVLQCILLKTVLSLCIVPHCHMAWKPVVIHEFECNWSALEMVLTQPWHDCWSKNSTVHQLMIWPLMDEEDWDMSYFSSGDCNVAQPQPLTEGNCNTSLHLKEITDLPLCFRRFRWLVSTCKDGWRAYYRQPVFLAGMGLAFLYTTVLGFDCITTGYAYTQGISGSLLSLLMGVSAITGLLGTVMFTRLRKTYGLVNTGIISSCLHLCCLLLCVCSVFAPGSPMDLSLLMPYITSNSSTELGRMATQRQKHTYLLRGGSNLPLLPDRSSIHWTNNTVLFDNVPSDAAPESYISIILLFLGVITARIGE